MINTAISVGKRSTTSAIRCVSLDGTRFFYPNPLESKGQHHRDPWFGVACCPGNITRFMASVPGYVYAQRDDAVWVNLFVASNADIIPHPGGACSA